MRRWHKAVIVVLVAYGALCAAAYDVMRQTPARFGQIMEHVPDVAFIVLPFKPLWFRARAGTLHVGDPAPDFTLPTQDNKASIRLASFRGSRPVVLVFGSYT
jgi:hypothetical protein